MLTSGPSGRRDNVLTARGSPEELAIIAIDLLVKELGTEGAQNFMNQMFLRYSTGALSNA